LGAIASGLATSFPWLLAARALTGLSQGTYFSPQYAISTAAVPPKYRTVASAVTMSGSALGIGLGTLIASFMVWRLGLSWRFPLVLCGGLALLLTLAMAKLINPDVARREATEEDSSPTPVFRPNANLVKLFLVGALAMYGFYVIVTWLPYYLQTARHIEGGIAGAVSTIMPLATIPSAILIGVLADRSGERRKIMLWLLPLGAIALALVVLSPSLLGLYIALLLYGLSGKLVIDPLLIAAVAEQTDASSHGKAFAFLNFAGTVSMVLAPTITGLIVDLTGSFDSGFLLAALLQAIAWGLLLSIRERGTKRAS
jgi:predicted MFS family arabinose efflux permease